MPRQAGSARLKRPGVYEFRLRLGNDPATGAPRRLSSTWHGAAKDVGRALAAWVTEQTATVVSTEGTLGWLVPLWIDLQEDAGLSLATTRTYRSYHKTWVAPRLGGVPISELNSGHLRELHAAMTRAGRSPSTIRQVHNIIRGGLTFAMEKEWIDRNVAALRRAPKLPPSEVVACTDDELAALLRGTDGEGCDLWAAIVLGASLGRRLGQLITIRWDDVDLDARTVTLQPTRKSPRAVALEIDRGTADRLAIRRDWQDARWRRVAAGPHPTSLISNPYVLSFWSNGDGPPRSDGYSHAFITLRHRLGFQHLHFHCLRHWCATTLINLGAPLPVVAERLGHSSPAVTARIYTHVVAGRSSEAAELIGGALPATNTRRPNLQLVSGT